MSQRPPIELVVQTSFPLPDGRKADQLEREIMKAAELGGAITASEGFDLTERHLRFSMPASSFARFAEMVSNQCERLRLKPDAVKIHASVRMRK